MDINTLLPPMIGSFVGVITAFALNYGYQYIKAKKDKQKYIKILRSEIEFCISIIERETIQLLPTEKWISLVNSGALKLLDVNIELEPLIAIYQEIQYYNAIMKYNIGQQWELVDEADETREYGNKIYNGLKKLRNFEWFK